MSFLFSLLFFSFGTDQNPLEGVLYLVADSPLDGAPTAGYDAEELGVENKEIQIAVRAHTGALLISQIAHMFVHVSPSLDSSIFRTLNLLQVCVLVVFFFDANGFVKAGGLFF